MKIYRSCLFYSFILFSIFVAGSAQAVMSPYYAYGYFSASRGGVIPVNIEEESATNAGLVSLEGGVPADYFCLGAGCPEVGDGYSDSWAELNADPVNGTIGALARSSAFNNDGGYAWGEAYISQVFRVGSDGSLENGDPVTLEAGMSLTGGFTSNSYIGRVESMMFVNKISGPDPYAIWEYLNWNNATEEYFVASDLMLGTSYYTDNVYQNLSVDHTDILNIDANVGDIIRIETMLWFGNDLGFSGSWTSSKTDFSNTLSSSLTPITPGATLTVVPEPVSSILFITGGVAFGIRSFLRKRKV